ncbi:MAG TPA: M56 family metallopeptidase [Gemmatimonadaceae bacterium]|jgi:hypothetical protein|nr:M56 family metallopeptidase [Gemmatimonadaceae bacterium]
MLTWLLVKMLLVGGVLMLGAYCAERLYTIQPRPTRWIWTSALLLTGAPLVIQLMDISFRSNPPVIQPRWSAPTFSAEQRERTRPPIDAFSQQTIVLRRSPPVITFAGHRIFIVPNSDLILAWGVLSVVAALFLAIVYLQFRRIRRRWPIGILQGVRVRIAPDGGPVVIGLWHPEIVIPQWLLGRSADEQRAVLAHEQEHIRAGDHWMLAGACGLVALVPWYPWVWWMVSRLRLAIELDCDARVMQRGVTPQTYGALLIDVAERGSGLPVRMLGLADTGSHLKRRLRRIGPRRPLFAAQMQVILFSVGALYTLPFAFAAVIPGSVEAGMGMTNGEGWGTSCGSSSAIQDRRDNHPYRGATNPRDSARYFFSSPGTSWTISSGEDIKGHALRWDDLLTTPPICDVKDVHYWEKSGNTMKHNPMRDSVLVLVDGVQHGVFPISARVPFHDLHLDAKVDHQYDISLGGHWATVLYGPEAVNGVIDITSDQKVAQLRVEALRIRDSLGLWSYTTDNPLLGMEYGLRGSTSVLGAQLELKKDLLPPIRWIDFFNDPIERARLRDSILVLANGTRLGVFPVHDLVSLRQLHIAAGEISAFRQTTAPWAAHVYGADAAHGVINIITMGDTTQPGRSRLRAGQ